MIQSSQESLRHYLAQASPFECQGHGACLLFDIVDSTGMKARHPGLEAAVRVFYEAFTGLVDSLAAEPVIEGRIVHKFLGDAAFAYLPVSLDEDRAVVQPDPRLLARHRGEEAGDLLAFSHADGDNGLIAALEFWNGGMIYNRKKNMIGVVRWYKHGGEP